MRQRRRKKGEGEGAGGGEDEAATGQLAELDRIAALADRAAEEGRRIEQAVQRAAERDRRQDCVQCPMCDTKGCDFWIAYCTDPSNETARREFEPRGYPRVDNPC